MLISAAHAEEPAAPGAVHTEAASAPQNYDAPSPFTSMAFPLLAIFVVFYFMMIRPSQKKIKQYEEMIKSLRRGDRIVTGGGIIGVITKIENDDVLVVEIAPETKVRIMRETISQVINKTAVNDNKADDKAARKADDKATTN